MVDIGSAIQGEVVRVEPYGILLKHGKEDVFVHLPETSWLDTRELRERFHLGQILDVYVLRYNYEKKQIVGSIRRLRPEQNPYRVLSRLEPGEILCGKVTCCQGGLVTVQLANGATGHIPMYRIHTDLRVGDAVEVVIAALEVDEGRLTLELLGKEQEPSGSPVEMAPFATAS
jgi:ribosomal protein S1